MTALAVFGGFIGVAILLAASSIFNGYALSVLWGWFVVPTFGLQKLSVVPAIGIAMVIRYLTHQIDITDKKRGGDESFGEKILKSTIIAILEPSFALLFGYIVHLFM